MGGEDGVSYGNPCGADCAGTKVKCDGSCPCKERKQEGEECGVLNNHGECDEGLICRQDPHPNTPATPGVCKTKACICPTRLQPVCGENWKVYGNACEARCEGIKVNCEGNCPCKGKMEEAGDTENPENSKLYSLPNCTDTKHITANNI